MQSLSYTTSPYYRPDIDGLRAIAVSLVVLCHAFPSTFGGGYIGVDIFFAISGYLISSILFRSMGKGNFSFLDFYAKRSRRIFPALIFVIVVGLLLGALLLTPREFKELGAEAMFGSFFFENIRMARGVDYFDLEIARKPFMHLWSLGVEEQFYMLFPFMLWGAWKLLKGRVGWLLSALLIASFATELYYQPIDESKAYFWPHCRFWQLGAGVLLAYAHYRSNESRLCNSVKNFLEKQGNWLSITALVTLLFCLFTFDSVTNQYPGYWAIIPTLCSIALIGAGKNSIINRTLLANPKTVFVGWLSYPIYLWHWLFLSIGFSLYAGKVPTLVTCALIVLSIVFSYISFAFIEVPIRQMKADKKMLYGTLGVLFFIGALSALVSKFDGFPSRLNAEQREALSTITNDRSVPNKNRCLKNYDFVCWSQTGQENGNVLLIGNSHTEHLMSVFANYAPEFARVDIYAAGGTRPLEGVVQRFTAKQLIRDRKAHHVLEAAKNSSAKLIVISNTWPNLNPNERVFLEDGSSEKFENVFHKTLKNLLASGKKVIYLIDNPTMPNEMENCMGLRPVNLVSGSCSIPQSVYEEQIKHQKDYFLKWAKTYPNQVFVVESGVALCDGNVCSMLSHSNQPLYTDIGHLTDLGASLVSKKAWKDIAPILQDSIE